MALNDLRLTPQLLTDLYANVLVENNSTGASSEKYWQLHGKNEKNILVLLNDDGELNESVKTFLINVLSACKLSMADVTVIIWKTGQDAYPVLTEQLKSRHVLLFGVSPLDFGLPVNFPHFQIQEFDKITYLFSPSLKEVENNVATKKKLWNVLKDFF